MSFIEEFDNLKKELREEWIKYYTANKETLKTLGLNKGEKWRSDKYQETYTLPRSEVILAVLLAIRPDLRKEIDFFGKTVGQGQFTKMIKELGLSFHIEKELENQSKVSEVLIENSSILDDIREQIKQQNGETT